MSSLAPDASPRRLFGLGVALGFVLLAGALAFGVLAPGTVAFAQDDPTAALGKPADYVLDEAGILNEAGRVRLARYLGKIERELNVQCAVVTVPTTGETSIEEYATKLYERWGMGGAKLDEGLLVLVAMDKKLVRFEVGYGLEPILTDGRSSAIIRNTIRPAFRRGEFADGLTEGMVDAARHIAVARGVPVPTPDGKPARSRAAKKIPPLVIVILIVLFIVFVNFVGQAQRRGHRGRGYGGRWGGPGPWIGGGMGGIGGGSWGGGSSGGFGGGSSGSGFGGFGGGMSGGGGATGGW